MVCRVSKVRFKVAACTTPSRRTKRVLSIVRIWSKTINPVLPLNVNGIRKAAGCDPVVMGATITVRRWFSISGGEISTHGRVFWISLPTVGSSCTNHTSPVAKLAGRFAWLTIAVRHRQRLQTQAKPEPHFLAQPPARCPKPSPHAAHA